MPSLFRSVGALSFPLSDTNETDFASLNPARDILLNLIAATINDEVGPRWADATAGSKIHSATPVKHKLPFEPTVEALQQLKADFPALFVYRDDSKPTKEDEFTLSQVRYTCSWGIDYILGPLDVGQRGKLGDILAAVGFCVSQMIRRGGHKAYATTTLPSNQVIAKHVLGPWGAGCCGFSTVAVTEFATGPAKLSKDAPSYWACSFVLETTELSNQVDGEYVSNFDGAEATLGTGDDTGIIEDLLVVNTDSEGEVWP